MDLLLNTVELTKSQKVHSALLEWAELLHLPEETAGNYQAKFSAGMDCGRVTSYAYQYTEDPEYRQHIEGWLNQPVIWFQEVGGRGPLSADLHLVPRNGERGSSIESADDEKFQLRDIADYFRNAPYCYGALESVGENEVAHRAR